MHILHLFAKFLLFSPLLRHFPFMFWPVFIFILHTHQLPSPSHFLFKPLPFYMTIPPFSLKPLPNVSHLFVFTQRQDLSSVVRYSVEYFPLCTRQQYIEGDRKKSREENTQKLEPFIVNYLRNTKEKLQDKIGTGACRGEGL